MNKQPDKFESIATKIAAERKGELEKALDKKGINLYQWFQMMAEITIRMFDDRHRLSSEMSQMIQLFQMIPGWKEPTSFLNPNDEPEVESAIYLMNTKGKSGLKAVMTQRGWIDGEWMVTENVMDIVEHVIEAALPQSYFWLRQRMAELGCTRVFECLLKLADEASTGTYESDIAEIFGDNDRSEYGEKPHEVPKKQRKKKGVEDMQGLFAFDDMDARMAIHTQEELEEQERSAREASQWLAENNDFRPIGGEW